MLLMLKGSICCRSGWSWDWLGSSLCPFFEGNDPANMAKDATLILPTRSHWHWSVAYASKTHGMILPSTRHSHCICLGNCEGSSVLEFTMLLITDFCHCKCMQVLLCFALSYLQAHAFTMSACFSQMQYCPRMLLLTKAPVVMPDRTDSPLTSFLQLIFCCTGGRMALVTF